MRIHSDEMAVALAVWLCALPLVGLVVWPRWGPVAFGGGAFVLLAGLLLLCWGMCGWKWVRRSGPRRAPPEV